MNTEHKTVNASTAVIPADMGSTEAGTNTLENPIVVKNPLDLATSEFSDSLNRRSANRNALMQWVKSALVDKTDYGRVPTKRGMSKPSLRKPGAEKICGMLGLAVQFPTLERYEAAAVDGREISQIILRCELVDIYGCIVASGIGARNLKQDYGDLNKSLKMAAKSAQIDATLRCAGLSEVFTQDLEDMPAHELRQELSEPPTRQTTEDTPTDSRPVTDKQISRLYALLRGSGALTKQQEERFIKRMKQAYSIESTKELNRTQYETVCNQSIPAFVKLIKAEHKQEQDRFRDIHYTDLNDGSHQTAWSGDDDAADILRDAGYKRGYGC